VLRRSSVVCRARRGAPAHQRVGEADLARELLAEQHQLGEAARRGPAAQVAQEAGCAVLAGSACAVLAGSSGQQRAGPPGHAARGAHGPVCGVVCTPHRGSASRCPVGPEEAGSGLLLRADGAAGGARGAHGPAEAESVLLQRADGGLAELGALTGLQKLDLSYCKGLTALPKLGALTGLQELALARPGELGCNELRQPLTPMKVGGE